MPERPHTPVCLRDVARSGSPTAARWLWARRARSWAAWRASHTWRSPRPPPPRSSASCVASAARLASLWRPGVEQRALFVFQVSDTWWPAQPYFNQGLLLPPTGSTVARPHVKLLVPHMKLGSLPATFQPCPACSLRARSSPSVGQAKLGQARLPAGQHSNRPSRSTRRAQLQVNMVSVVGERTVAACGPDAGPVRFVALDKPGRCFSPGCPARAGPARPRWPGPRLV